MAHRQGNKKNCCCQCFQQLSETAADDREREERRMDLYRRFVQQSEKDWCCRIHHSQPKQKARNDEM